MSGAVDPCKTELRTLCARPGFLLRRAHQISVAIFERACADCDLTPAQYAVLAALRGRSDMDQSTLARALGYDKVTIVRVLQIMEGRHLVERTPAPDDRRAKRLRLTTAGTALHDAAQRPVERAYRTFLAPLSKPQQQELIDMLDLLAAQLDRHARAPLVRSG